MANKTLLLWVPTPQKVLAYLLLIVVAPTVSVGGGIASSGAASTRGTDIPICGFRPTRTPISGDSASADPAVSGTNCAEGAGIVGTSVKGEGVFGEGHTNGVHGKSSVQQHSGVFGENTRDGVGVAGKSVQGEGVIGEGGTNGVHGVSSASAHSGVYGENTGKGVGLAGVTEQALVPVQILL